ncbi:HNH endonuclease signature motif containing protein [Rhodococcus erythropolis]|uniref:HNH endonuclease signature motif containing protein n=1 Tax=Rhodococcus TaxID=1827 RepID=UPI0009BA4960
MAAGCGLCLWRRTLRRSSRCGRFRRGRRRWEVHHILPRKYGGTNEFWNLVPLPTSIHALFTRWWEFYADIYN